MSLLPELLPLKNVPIAVVDETSPDRLADAIRTTIGLHLDLGGPITLSASAVGLTSFDAVQRFAAGVLAGADALLRRNLPVVVVFTDDRAKVVGQAIRAQNPLAPVLCIDGIATTSGDYIDIGLPIGGGRAVPVVVKTLVFNETAHERRPS